MNNLISLEDFLLEKKTIFTEEQIQECLTYLNSEDEQLLEAWYNTVLDFAALIPGVGSIAEGINLVSYAKQGEYLLAGLCAIGLIPIFGQYIGAGGVLLVKALGKGTSIGKGILKPLVDAVAKFFPAITKFLKSPKFASKFKGIRPYVDKMIASLKNFVTGGGKQLDKIAQNRGKLRAMKKEVRNLKQGVKIGEWALGSGPSTPGRSEVPQIPVPKDAYMSYGGTPLRNIRPYTDTEISQAEFANNWEMYL